MLVKRVIDNRNQGGVLFVLLGVLLCLAACKSAKHGTNPNSISESSSAITSTLDSQPSTLDSLLRQAQEPSSPLTSSLSTLLDTAAAMRQMQVAMCVYDITADSMLFEYGANQRMRPASTEKLVTAITALEALGADYTLKTQLRREGEVKEGCLEGNLWVVGGMDPLLKEGDVRRMVGALQQQGITKIAGYVYFDASLKDTLKWGSGWCWDDDNPTLSPLLCNAKPLLKEVFVEALQKADIAFDADKVKCVLHRSKGLRTEPIFVVERPLREVMLPMMKESDNLCAEAVFYQLGASLKDVRLTIGNTLRHAGVNAEDVTIADGCGLSLYNYQTPLALTKLLAYASRSERLLPLLWETLPIAGIDGTLKRRFRGTKAAGRIRAKTGSVTGVFSLAGYVQPQHSGHLLAFAILTNGAKKGAISRTLQDEICKYLVDVDLNPKTLKP